jgi:uncharacterized protein YegP (UPF0339 family)
VIYSHHFASVVVRGDNSGQWCFRLVVRGDNSGQWCFRLVGRGDNSGQWCFRLAKFCILFLIKKLILP